MGKSCKEVAQSLFDCIKETSCVKNGGDIRNCLRDKSQSEECQVYRNAYTECRRSGLDMRSRIKGVRVY